MINAKLLATQAALRKMFKEQGHFSICSIDNLVKMNGVVVDGEVYAVMRTLHCVDYAQMKPELVQWLVDETLKMFGGPALDLSGIDDIRPNMLTITVDPITEKRGILRKLLG